MGQWPDAFNPLIAKASGHGAVSVMIMPPVSVIRVVVMSVIIRMVIIVSVVMMIIMMVVVMPVMVMAMSVGVDPVRRRRR